MVQNMADGPSENGLDFDLHDHARFCFQLLEAKLAGKKAPKYTLPDVPNCPLFVTWMKREGKEKSLRGCIGTFDRTRSLSKVLSEYALLAAIDDDRFEPISEDEVSSLTVAVSLLVNFSDKPLRNPLKWTVGKHGVDMELIYKGKHYSSTFLPEVAEEEGWDQRTTLLELLLKDEFPIDDLKDAADLDKVIKLMKVTTYESVKVEVSYDEYVKQSKK